MLDGVGGNDAHPRPQRQRRTPVRTGGDLHGDAGLDDMKGENGRRPRSNGNDGDRRRHVDCGADDALAIFNGDDPGDPGDLGDLLFANCERTQQG